MADREWRGHWWLPSQPEDAVPGTLIQRESDGELVLKLIGGFNIEKLTPIDEHQSSVSFDGNFPLVVGQASGELFSLLECYATHTSGGFLSRAIAEQDISVQRGLRGMHLESTEEEVFDSAVLNIEYLLGWTHKSTLQANIELNEWKWTGKQTAKSEPVDDITAIHNGYTYALRLDYNQFRINDKPRANERSLANREWAELTIKSEVPRTFAGFDSPAKAIMDLMTLVAHAPAGIIRETVCFTSSEEHPVRRGHGAGQVEVMGRRIHQPKPLNKETARVDYLFTLEDIDFAEVLPRWLELHEQAWLACSILSGLSYIREGYTSSRLLSAATAAEALHRSLVPDATRIAPDRFDEIRKTVMAALAGKQAEMAEARTFVSNSLYNEIAYKDRLLALAALPDSQAVARLIGDLPKWAKYVKDQRNGLAHGNRERVEADISRMTYDTLEITRALLGLVLLSQMGLSVEVQRRAATLPYLEVFVSEFNKALAQI